MHLQFGVQRSLYASKKKNRHSSCYKNGFALIFIARNQQHKQSYCKHKAIVPDQRCKNKHTAKQKLPTFLLQPRAFGTIDLNRVSKKHHRSDRHGIILQKTTNNGTDDTGKADHHSNCQKKPCSRSGRVKRCEHIGIRDCKYHTLHRNDHIIIVNNTGCNCDQKGMKYRMPIVIIASMCLTPLIERIGRMKTRITCLVCNKQADNDQQKSQSKKREAQPVRIRIANKLLQAQKTAGCQQNAKQPRRKQKKTAA